MEELRPMLAGAGPELDQIENDCDQQRCSQVAPGADLLPKSGQFSATSDERWPIRGKNWPNLDPHWPNFGQHRLILANTWPTMATMIDQMRLASFHFGELVPKISPKPQIDHHSCQL